MNDQDKRAVEGLARSGISFEGLCEAFPRFSADKIKVIYDKVSTMINGSDFGGEIKRNCS